MIKNQIFNKLRETGYDPEYLSNQKTLIRIKSGAIYMLSYAGKGWVGWSIQEGILHILQKSYPNYCIVLLDNKNRHIYIIPHDYVGKILKRANYKNGTYKVSSNRELLPLMGDISDLINCFQK